MFTSSGSARPMFPDRNTFAHLQTRPETLCCCVCVMLAVPYVRCYLPTQCVGTLLTILRRTWVELRQPSARRQSSHQARFPAPLDNMFKGYSEQSSALMSACLVSLSPPPSLFLLFPANRRQQQSTRDDPTPATI
ncbi:hypothetical protein LX32DRAFT_418974 [Colletotrichum zoysiae]|uniref:Uncharacterized protein n=1 Tax=Colletotrichum zoysiae TaxID=1216348 RepID=A0AAD9M5R3_9PEZI|nr:hypothetical protein LX32DRAFT_418974 [Colletotrichum zoysiae]